MINHAVDNLTPQQEDSFLTARLVGYWRVTDDGRRCWLGVMDLTAPRHVSMFPGFTLIGYFSYEPCRFDANGNPQFSLWRDQQIADRFNALYTKVGAARLGQLIRDRI